MANAWIVVIKMKSKKEQTLETRIKTFPIVKLDWQESERDWGIRPDGYSLHKSIADSEAFVKEYWKGMPDKAPDEYSRPGQPYIFEVDAKTYRQISASKNGIRVWW
ncbi:MAG: hypothetical protein HY438_01865 [DPANN group archaeon]|nr:hypothetical protein [DPANN group archaeon]